MSQTVRSIIVDADVGSDDAWALLILLLAEKLGFIRILAVLASNGNTGLDNVVANTVRMFNLLEISNIPIYKGVNEPLFLHENENAHDNFHGKDGMGDLKYDWDPDYSMVQNSSGILGIRNVIAAEPPNTVSLLCLGPLTNAALLLKTFGDEIQLSKIAIMGGNHKGVGNITPAAEFNFYFDPEAARIVFEKATSPVLLLPWESCIKYNITTNWRFNINPMVGNKYYDVITAADRKIYNGATLWKPCDAFLAAAFAFPKHMDVGLQIAQVWVETQGLRTRGQAVIDATNPEDINAHIIVGYSVEGFKNLITMAANNSF